MTPANLAAWSVQVAVLVTAGIAGARLLAWRHPASRLRFLQALLLLALLLPLAAVRTAAPAPAVVGRVIRVDADRLVLGPPLPSPPPRTDWARVLAWALAGGAAVRLGWLAWRLAKLRLLRSRAELVEHPGVPCEVRLTRELRSPATFGWWRPVILLPASIDDAARAHALRHELEHIRGRDWPQSIAEEMIGALLWFHPAIAWLRNRIRLAREQAVDAAVAGTGAQRDGYIDSLLRSAGVATLPAAPFARRRQLVEREAFLTEEDFTMNPKRILATAVAVTALLAVALAAVRAYYPIAVEAQATEPLIREVTVAGETPEGDVVVQATLDTRGEVVDARVESGLEAHRREALQMVLGSQFAAGVAQRLVPVIVRFRRAAPTFVADALPRKKAPAPLPIERAVFEGVDYNGLSPELQGRVAALLHFGSGSQFTLERVAQLQNDLAAIDKQLTIYPNVFQRPADATPRLRLRVTWQERSGIPSEIRVGQNVQAANLLHRVEPEYPALARQVRVQGAVVLGIQIDKTGNVVAAGLMSGHPLLAPAAQRAVLQYRYRPTLLNGQPVAVRTTVEVHFVL